MFESVYRMELVGIPLLKEVVMKSSFKCLQSAFVNKAGVLDDLAKIEQLKKTHATICSCHSLDKAAIGVDTIHISANCCNEAGMKELVLTRFLYLRELCVDDECFENVNEVKLVGLKKLERVVIGNNCFTQYKNSFGKNPDRHFYLKDCARLRELRIGYVSFSDYAVCEIESNESLEVVEMGDDNDWSRGFYYASLTMKSGSHR